MRPSWPRTGRFRRRPRSRRGPTSADTDIYEQGGADLEALLGRASAKLDWFKPWDTVLEWEPAVRQMVRRRQAERLLQLPRSPRRRPGAATRSPITWKASRATASAITYTDLLDEVCRCANALKELGVKRGDRVAIYMPMIPELPVAMLACARIGAPHTVVFGGFSAEALRRPDQRRRGEASSITADGGFRRGKPYGLKVQVDRGADR